MSSTSIQSKSSKLSNDKLQNAFVGTLQNEDYLDFEDTQDIELLAAKGINLLFTRFPYAIQTFQFIKTDPLTGKTNAPVKLYTDSQTALKESLQYNKKGYDVFYMVNEGDGITHEGKKYARSQQSVLNLNACFIDTDNCPYNKVTEYLHSINLQPHIIVESSPKRYHIYFLIEPIQKSKESIDKWKAVQNMLHRLGDVTIKNPAKELGTDSTMSDYSKVLRVPGFRHISKSVYTKTIADQDIPIYTLDDLSTVTNSQSFVDYTVNTYGSENPVNVPSLTDTTPIDKGDRFQSLQSLALHLANNGSTYSDNLALYTLFTRQRIVSDDNVYLSTDNNLTQKALDLFNSAQNKVKKELDVSRSLSIQTLENPIEKKDPWILEDDFYLNAPNGFGDVVRQVMQYSMYPCAALAFGTFLTGLSILKAKTHLTPNGSSPALYILNVAPSGFGKNDPMTLLQNMFVDYGYGSLIENEIRSDRGLYTHLESNQGFGFFILDEIAPLIRGMQDKKASSYMSNILKVILSLYSAGALRGVSLGKLGSSGKAKGEKAIVLDNPMCAICGYTVPSEFKAIFSSESIATGLFQRFIPIVTDVKYVEDNPNADKTARIKSDLFTAHLRPVEIDQETGEPVSPLIATPRVKMPYTVEARKYAKDLRVRYRKIYVDTAQDEDTESASGLYSRIAEQVERVATVLSVDEITLETLEYAAKFIESRHEAIMAVSQHSILRGKGSETQEKETRLLRAITNLCEEGNTATVFKRDVYLRCRKSFQNVREFEAALHEASEAGTVILTPNFKKEAKGSRPGLGLSLGDVL